MEFPKKKYYKEYKGKQNERNKNKNSEKKDKSIDILDYFLLDEDKNNIINNLENKSKDKNEEKSEENSKDNNVKINYNVHSFISSNYRPDLYSPLGIIGGNKYSLKRENIQEKDIIPLEESDNEEKEEEKNEERKSEKEEEKQDDKEIESKSVEKMDEKNEMELEKYKLLKTGRYYALEDDITIKCHNCGDVGHIKDYCPYINLKFCHRCLSNNHNDKDCRNKKCFRCNRSGHNMKECDIKDSDIILCFNCQNSGHRKNECLIKPSYIESKLLKNNGLSCFSCGSNKHLICPLSTRNNIELKEENINIEDDKEDKESEESFNINNSDISSDSPMEEEEEEEKKKLINKKKKKRKEKKQIFENLKNEEIKYTIFCGYCAGMHRNENCPLKDEYSNEFDEARKNIIKKILDKRNKENEEQQKYNLQKKRKRGNNNNDEFNYNNYSNNKNNKNNTSKIFFDYLTKGQKNLSNLGKDWKKK